LFHTGPQQSWKERQRECLLLASTHNSSNWILKAALADFPHGLEKKARTTSHAFLCAHPGSKSYPAALRPLKELNGPLLYGLAGPAKSPSPQLRRLAAG
ncbi:hypothetical protein CRENBAI_011379, partial [Crenichthys baileyi]